MRSLALVVLSLATLGFGACLLLMVPVLLISTAVFDRPAAAGSPLTWLVLIGLWSFPPLVLYGLARAWPAYRRQAHREALLAMLIPVAALALTIATWSLWPVVCLSNGQLGCL